MILSLKKYGHKPPIEWLFKIIYLCLCVYVWTVPEEVGKGVGPPRAGVTDAWELSIVCTET